MPSVVVELTSEPSPTLQPTRSQPVELEIGVEGLLADLPESGDAWRMCLVEVRHGADALPEGMKPPKIEPGWELLAVWIQFTYVGTRHSTVSVPRDRFRLLGLKKTDTGWGPEVVGYVPVGSFPTEDWVGIGRDERHGYTLFYSVPEGYLEPGMTPALLWMQADGSWLAIWYLDSQSAPTPERTATASASALLPTHGPYPPAVWGETWRTVVGRASDSNPWARVELLAPLGVYIVDWVMTEPCQGVLDNAGATWGFGDTKLGLRKGLDLVELVHEEPSEALACDTWAFELRPVGNYFGPNSVQVARLLMRLQRLAYRWTEVEEEEVSARAIELETRVLDAAKRDPNLGAAVQHALSENWYRGNNYVLNNPNAARLRGLAILAEVAQDLLNGREFDALYGPMADYVDPLRLGIPVDPGIEN